MEINDFVIPPLEEEKELPTNQQASEQAFYAAATDKVNPIGSFMDAKQDLLTNGSSQIVDQAQANWEEEQNNNLTSTIEDVITDPTIDRNVKLNVINKYRLGDYLPKDLKERYIQKTAADDSINDTETQRKQQDWVVANIQRRREQMAFDSREYDIENNRSKLQSFLGGITHLYEGAGNTLGLVSDEQYKKGHEEFEKLKEENPISAGAGNVVGLIGGALTGGLFGLPGVAAMAGTLAGTSRFAELGQTKAELDDRIKASLSDAGFTAADFALPIFKAAGFLKAMILNGAGAVTFGELNTAAQNYILDAYPELQREQFNKESMTINALLGGLIGGVFGRSAKKGVSSVEPDSTGSEARRPTEPFKPSPHEPQTFEGESTRVNESPLQLVGPEASPTPIPLLPNTLGTKAIPPSSPAKVTEMANPKIAADLGITALRTDGAMADALGTNKASIVHDWVLPKMDESEMSVDLSRELKAKDEEMREVFEDMRYNPSVVNATKRDEDNSKIYEVIRETRAAAYQPANSLMNFADNVVEGKMVFGPNETGLFTERANAEHAYKGIKETVDSLPVELRGNLAIVEKSPNRFSVEWSYRKEYDDSMILTFGPDSIKTSVLGIDMSAVARSMASRGFFPIGRFEGGFEQGAIRAPERQARLQRQFLTGFNETIGKTKHKKELGFLIQKAEEEGKEAFTKKELGALFPDLKNKELDNLFDAHTYWRRMNHYMYTFANRELKNDLISKDMVGAYAEDGTYLGPVSNKWTQAEVDKIRSVWNYETNSPTSYKPDAHPEGKTLVRLGNRIEEGGQIFEYGLIGAKQRIDLLPNEVLPRIPGYSPRKVSERWFVDAIPKKLVINGVTVSDAKLLRDNYTKTIAASKNEFEGNAIIENMKDSFPDHELHVRPDRQDTFGKVIDGMEIHSQMLQQSSRRGERLPSLDGPAQLEDRLVTAINMAKGLSSIGAFREWENAFKESFVKSFPRFIDKGQFPMSKAEITPLPNMTRDENKLFQTALRSWEYFQNQKNFETLGDHLWKKNLHNLADVFERMRVPNAAVEATRVLGDKDNLLVRIPKQVASFSYIHSQPLRQWLIQPAQLLEYALVTPGRIPDALRDLAHARILIASEFLKGGVGDYARSLYKASYKASGGNVDEFEKIISAIKKSGMIEGIDMNVLVHGIFKDVERNLVENTAEKMTKDMLSLAKTLPAGLRAVGFDAAELTNRIGMFLQTRAQWVERNPGKKWDTKENLEKIAADAMIRTGTMNRAGNLPYQEGALSVLMQFAAISQKLTMNVLQDGLGGLTGSDRAKLAAARLGLYGLEGGLVGLGPALYYFVDQSEDEEMVNAANDVRVGLIDYASNKVIASVVDPDTPSDLAVSQGMSPYSEHFLPYFDVASELIKLFDNSPSTNPRLPFTGVMGSFMTAVNEMRGWFVGREINEQNFKQTLMEAAEVTSGFSNYSKGLLILGSKEKVTSFGNSLGIQYSAAEGYGKMLFGINSNKEAQEYELLAITGDFKQGIEQVAKDIHKSMMNIRTKIGEQEWENRATQINAFMSLLPSTYTNQHKVMIIEQLMKLDRRSYTTLRESLYADILKYHRDGQGTTATKLKNNLSRSVDPKTQEFLKLYKEGKL